MPTVERVLGRASRAFDRHTRDLGDEFRERRLELALSQSEVAKAAKTTRNRCGRIENHRCANITIAEIDRIGAVLGLDVSIRVYPVGRPIRDVGHARTLVSFLASVATPLVYRTEVPLPIVADRVEHRAWDAVIFRARERCAIELEMRLRDVQALVRRVDLKRRDDPPDRFLLLVVGTRRNRLALAEFETLFSDLPRLRPSTVRAALVQGRLPQCGLLPV